MSATIILFPFPFPFPGVTVFVLLVWMFWSGSVLLEYSVRSMVRSWGWCWFGIVTSTSTCISIGVDEVEVDEVDVEEVFVKDDVDVDDEEEGTSLAGSQPYSSS